eukprot:jgi/Ulvmu1/7487/UM037_0031.1
MLNNADGDAVPRKLPSYARETAASARKRSQSPKRRPPAPAQQWKSALAKPAWNPPKGDPIAHANITIRRPTRPYRSFSKIQHHQPFRLPPSPSADVQCRKAHSSNALEANINRPALPQCGSLGYVMSMASLEDFCLPLPPKARSALNSSPGCLSDERQCNHAECAISPRPRPKSAGDEPVQQLWSPTGHLPYSSISGPMPVQPLGIIAPSVALGGANVQQGHADQALYSAAYQTHLNVLDHPKASHCTSAPKSGIPHPPCLSSQSNQEMYCDGMRVVVMLALRMPVPKCQQSICRPCSQAA